MRKFILLLMTLLLIPIVGYGAILPDLFYQSSEDQKQYCSKNNGDVWFDLMANHIDKLIGQHTLNEFEHDVLKNQLVTLSYLELFRLSQGEINSMTYVYANASHHLGRLVRAYFWENFPNEELGARDKALISGEILGTTVKAIPRYLSRTLMTHSLQLYKTLSWTLAASLICGQDYVREYLSKSITKKSLEKLFPQFPVSRQKGLLLRLKKAYSASNYLEFITSFVAFEQTYLQFTMYTVPSVRFPSSLGVLDKMRFIPFNGERSLSYYDWCRMSNCRKRSFNLEHRILFDQTIISEEVKMVHKKKDRMETRLKNTELEAVTHFVLNNLIPGWSKEDLVNFASAD